MGPPAGVPPAADGSGVLSRCLKRPEEHTPLQSVEKLLSDSSHLQVHTVDEPGGLGVNPRLIPPPLLLPLLPLRLATFALVAVLP